jgi:hypothetical protein
MSIAAREIRYGSKQRHYHDISLWKDVTPEQWNDWKWQLTHTINTVEDLAEVVHLTPQELEGIRHVSESMPLRITPSKVLEIVRREAIGAGGSHLRARTPVGGIVQWPAGIGVVVGE